MASGVKVKSNFAKIAADFPREVQRAQDKTGKEVARRAASRRGGASFGDDTGTTRRSITWLENEHQVIMFGDAGQYVEYGTPPRTTEKGEDRGQMPAFRPLRRAARSGRIAFVRRVRKILRDAGKV